MAADKKPTIVIKKITVQAAGAHGGSWKVAFADFMTAMMAFFLVMWLVNQSEEVKKSVAEYFSTPSIIEYNFSNYGAELTLEKLFLDLVNEPLKAFEEFVKPVDKIPNVMDMGHKKFQVAFLKNKLGEFGVNVDVLTDEITFEIPTSYLFAGETPRPGGQFVPVMERVREIVQGLKDTDIFINSEQPVKRSDAMNQQKFLAEARLDLISQKIEASVQGDNVDVYGKTTVERVQSIERRDTRGMIKFRIKQKFNEVPKVKVQQDQDMDMDQRQPQSESASAEPAATDATHAPGARTAKRAAHPEDAFSSFVNQVSGEEVRDPAENH